MASRTKALLAKNAADQDLHRHLADARRALDQALDVCRRVVRSRDEDMSTLIPGARAREHQIRAILGQLNAIGHLAKPGSDDPDLTPEGLKVSPAKARRLAEQKKQQEGRKADQELLKKLGWAE